MQRLLPALLFLVAAPPAWGHPMPSSAVVLRLHRTEIDAELTLPIGELAIGWEKPLPLDSVTTVQKYGAELEEYVRAHVRPSAPDGRPWAVTVRGVTPLIEKEPDVRVALTMTPPPGAPVDRLTPASSDNPRLEGQRCSHFPLRMRTTRHAVGAAARARPSEEQPSRPSRAVLTATTKSCRQEMQST